MICDTCDGGGWITEVYGEGEVVKDGYWDCAPDFAAEEETVDEARARMTAEERAADAAWVVQQEEKR